MQNHTRGFGYSCPDICRLSSCFEHPDFRMMGKMLPWNQMKKKMTKRTAGEKDTQIDKDLVFHSVSYHLNASRFGEDLAISRVHTDAKTLMLKTS